MFRGEKDYNVYVSLIKHLAGIAQRAVEQYKNYAEEKNIKSLNIEKCLYYYYF